MVIRQQAFQAIMKCFERHGGEELDTPVFELKVKIFSCIKTELYWIRIQEIYWIKDDCFAFFVRIC